MAQNAHMINNPMDVIQADETADIAIANGYQSIAIANGRKSQAVATETNSIAIAIADNSVATALKIPYNGFRGCTLVVAGKGRYRVVSHTCRT